MNLPPRWHYELARLLLLLRQDKLAIAQFEATLRRDPRFVSAHESLAFFHASEGRSAAAIEAFRRALALAPDHASTWFNLGFVHHGRNEHEQAIQAFEKAVGLSPSLDRAWYGMGLAQRSLGLLPEAAASLERSGKLQPMNPHAWYELGMTYYAMKRYEKVQEVIEYLDGFDPKMTRQLMQDTPGRAVQEPAA